MNVYVIGWALVHSIWQGAAIAALVAVIFAVTRRQSPALRYWVGLTGLALMVGLPVATAMRGNLGPGAGSESASDAFVSTPTTLVSDVGGNPLTAERTIVAPESDATAQQPIAALPESIARIAESSIPWIVAAWFAGLLIASVRLIGGISRTRQLTRRGVSPGNEKLEAAIARLSASLGIRRVVRVLESSRTVVPLVVGAWRPVIVIPASLMTGLTPLQLDMLLTHELAHIRHHDFLVNLVQTVIETLMFYHPAVRWLSNRVREERENRCDDVAVAASGGNAHAYTETLLALEESRSPEIGLAAAATGGSLLRRARRLLLGEPAHIDIGPRWIAGFITIAAALFLARDAVGLGVQSSFTPVVPAEIAEDTDTLEKRAKRRNLPDPSRGAPASVLRAPAGGTLAERWSWAEQKGRATGSSYWVGYLVGGDPTGKARLYSDDVPVYISDGDVTLTGHMNFMDADFSGLTFSGVPLRGLVGNHLDASTAMFFLLSNGLTGRRIERIHVGSFVIPMYFDRKPLVWLDSASDRESIAKIRSLSSRARSEDMKRDLVGAVGSHYSPEVVPYLAELLASRTEPDDIRKEAAEWLGRANGPAIPALSRAVRTDRSNGVREEAIEAFSHMDVGSATDTLISFASSLETFDQRKTAIEALGHRKDARALDYLTRIATSETDSNLPGHAIEALGDMPDGMGFSRVVQIARTSRSSESRKEAIDAISSSDEKGRPLDILVEIARTDPDEEVRIAAVEAIASVHDRGSVAILLNIARSRVSESIQEAAAEALSSTVDNAAAMIALRSLVADHPSYEVRERALEAMIDMKGGEAIVTSIARTTKDVQLRDIALEILNDNK